MNAKEEGKFNGISTIFLQKGFTNWKDTTFQWDFVGMRILTSIRMQCDAYFTEDCA